MTLNDLINKTLKLVKTTQAGNIFTFDKLTVLLKPVNRDFLGKSKKPLYYLSAIENGKAEYLSGLFATNDDATFSGDYKDGIGLKHIVHVVFAAGGAEFTVKAV